MLSREALMILSLLKTAGVMDGEDIETETGLTETAIKKAAVELRNHGFVKTSGAPNGNEADGMAIDRLTITPHGQRPQH
jgi:DNA-binding IscR family transcriptional regulator